MSSDKIKYSPTGVAVKIKAGTEVIFSDASTSIWHDDSIIFEVWEPNTESNLRQLVGKGFGYADDFGTDMGPVFVFKSDFTNVADLTTSNVNTFDNAVGIIASNIISLIIAKQKDYGKRNILDFGEMGIVIRSNDKFSRLKNLLNVNSISPGTRVVPNNESIEDTWKDIAGYAIIALMLRKGWFELPLKEDK